MAEEANRIEEGIAEGVKELAVEAKELVEEVVEETPVWGQRLRQFQMWCDSVAVVIHVMPVCKMNPRWQGPVEQKGWEGLSC